MFMLLYYFLYVYLQYLYRIIHETNLLEYLVLLHSNISWKIYFSLFNEIIFFVNFKIQIRNWTMLSTDTTLFQRLYNVH